MNSLTRVRLKSLPIPTRSYRRVRKSSLTPTLSLEGRGRCVQVPEFSRIRLLALLPFLTLLLRFGLRHLVLAAVERLETGGSFDVGFDVHRPHPEPVQVRQRVA